MKLKQINEPLKRCQEKLSLFILTILSEAKCHGPLGDNDGPSKSAVKIRKEVITREDMGSRQIKPGSAYSETIVSDTYNSIVKLGEKV